MSRPIPRFALLVLVLLPIPFLYNACHGSLFGLGTNGFTSSNSSLSCKVMMEKGEYTKVRVDSKRPPEVFSTRKVRLRDDAASAMVPSKAEAPMTVAAGSRLSLIFDNKCLQDNDGQLSGQPLSLMAMNRGELFPSLNRQAYEWILDRDYTDREIEDLAAQETCVVGVSWNHDYKVQSMAFNDTDVLTQTHLPAIKSLEADDYFYAATGGMATSGSDLVLIAVIDTGVDWQHPDITANIWAHSQGYGVDATTLKTSLVDFNPNDISPVGHGTHVSGMIAAVSNNNTGIVGVMPYRAKIMAIKVFKADASNNLSTTSTYFYNAMQFAYLNNASVINLSLDSVTDGPASDSVAEAGVDEAVQHGVTVITVIGNADTGNGGLIDGQHMSSIPGMYAAKTGVIGVGAFDTTTGLKSYFSHYSTTYAEIGAPGAESADTGLYSTIPTTLGSYGRLSGTSQAGPQVSAAAGLAIGLIKNSYSVAPTPAEVERLILASATKSAPLAPYFKDGNRLNLVSLVRQINQDYPLTRSGLPIPAPGCE